MPRLRAEAEMKINARFGPTALDLEHAAKRLEASRVAAGGTSAALEAEAALSGTTAAALAAVILTKPDDVLERGLQRRQAILAVRAAKTPAEIAALTVNVT